METKQVKQPKQSAAEVLLNSGESRTHRYTLDLNNFEDIAIDYTESKLDFSLKLAPIPSYYWQDIYNILHQNNLTEEEVEQLISDFTLAANRLIMIKILADRITAQK